MYGHIKTMIKVIDIIFYINGIQLDKYWRKFLVKDETETDFEITVLDNYICRYGIEQFAIEESICFRYGKEIMFTDKDWKKIKILPPFNLNNINVFIIQAFYKHALEHQTIQVHCSIISFNKKGILFLGASGIGKTTQAELWKLYKKAIIINGDIGFVQKTQKGFVAWGSPWHGSSEYCENMCIPIKAMIVLRKANTNSIKELSGFEKVIKVSDNVFYPTWLDKGMETCAEILNSLLSTIPIYELSCRPDEEAVELTEKTIFGREN